MDDNFFTEQISFLSGREQHNMKYQNVEKLLLISLMIWSCSDMALAAPADVEHNEAEDALLREQRELLSLIHI